MILKPENYCIPLRHTLFGQTTKQRLSNFEPWKTWKNKQLWGLKPDPNRLWRKIKCTEIKVIKNIFLENVKSKTSYDSFK